jgi:hypothetical protein
MKFTAKGLITLFVTGSALFLIPMRSNAQVNMKRLAQVADSCQKDVVSKSYYQQMGLDINTEKISSDYLDMCIKYRYHYSLVLSRFPWLVSTGEILPGYPSSVGIGTLANSFSHSNSSSDRQLLDCLISQKASSSDESSECYSILIDIAPGGKYRGSPYLPQDINTDNVFHTRHNYLLYVCPSCVVAHDEVSGSREVILKAFIEWFIKLDKPQRREVISLLGDEDEARQLRKSLDNESEKAVEEYRETRARVQQQEQERRRRELLGN